MRVRVPFGRQHLIGVVQSLATRSEVPPEKLKAVLEVIDATPVIDAQVMELLEWAAQYYHHPLGEVIAAALPKLAREGAASRAQTERWFATDAGLAALEAGELKRAPRQRELLEILRAPEGVARDALAASVRRLAHADARAGGARLRLVGRRCRRHPARSDRQPTCCAAPDRH